MNFPARLRHACAPLLFLALVTPCPAQQQTAKPAARHTAPAAPQTAAPAPPTSPAAQAQAAKPQPTPAVTFDTLLAADAYAIYGEVRGLGQYINSQEMTELLAPLNLPGGAPPELLDLFNFMRAHADELMTARVMFAAMPARPKLPEVIAAVELSSPEQAQKFEVALRKFLKAHVSAPTDGRSDGATTNTTSTETVMTARGPVFVTTLPDGTHRATRRANRAKDKTDAPQPPPFQLERVGTLLITSDTPFTLAALRPKDAPLLTEEAGFQTARARLAHETLFVYFNTKRMERNGAERRARYEREAAEQREEIERARRASGATDDEATLSGDSANPNAAASAGTVGRIEVAPASRANPEAVPPVVDGTGRPVPPPPVVGRAEPILISPDEPPPPTPTPEEEKKLSPEEEAQAQQQRMAQQLFSVLPSLLFGGASSTNSWPESIAAAAELSDNELVVRALFVSDGEERPARPIPFVPLLLSGPAVAPEAANVLPADTHVLVSASLDLPQMYDYVASALGILDLANGQGRKGAQDSFSAQLAGFEKANGFRIKEDLLAALGNEIAIAAPASWFGVRAGKSGRATGPRATPGGPVFVVALNDKRALQELLPRALAAAGLRGVTTQQLIEKRGDVELLTLAQGSIAFIDRFLVVAPNAETMRHITDAYNDRDTLANSEDFRSAGGWEPRHVLGQIYVSKTFLKNAFEDPKAALEEIDDPAVREVLAKLDAEPGALTHALTKDDQGLLHELHVPKSVLSLMSADALISRELAPLRSHEGQAQYALQGLFEAEQAYKEKHGKYASLDELKRLAEEQEKREEAAGDEQEGEGEDLGGFVAQAEGYDFKLNISGDKFEATATPAVYRKTGRRSFYVDQTGVVRAADTNGKPADANAPPVD